METNRNFTFYNNEWSAEKENSIREWAKECGDGEITDNEMWKRLNNSDEVDYDYFVDSFNEFCKKGKNLLIIAKIGTWRGTFDGGKVIEYCQNWADVLNTNLFKHCNYFDFYEDKAGDLHLEGTHHDGTNHFLVKEINQEGEDVFQDWKHPYTPILSKQNIDKLCKMSERELHTLLKDKFCNPIKLSEYC